MTTDSARDAVPSFNKHVHNPAMLLFAGRPHWNSAVIRHTGRRSRRAHATPAVAERLPDRLIVALPDGTGVDWLRNALATGHPNITVGGRSHDVVDPRIIGAASASAQLSPRRRRAFQLFDIDEYVRFADRNQRGAS